MNFMKKILVPTNSTTTSSPSNQPNASAQPADSANSAKPVSNSAVARNASAGQQAPNQMAQPNPQTNPNKSPATQPMSSEASKDRKQQIELERQLEKQRILREYRQSSSAKSQESSNQLEFSTADDFNSVNKTKARGLSLCATGDALAKHNTQDIGLALLNKLFLSIKAEHNKLIQQYGQKGPTKYDQLGLASKQELERNIYKLLPLFMKTFNSSASKSMPEMKVSSSMQSFVGHKNVNNKNVDLFDQFHDLPCFAQIISRLMVNEIRKRASQKTTQEASQSVVKFLELSANLNRPADSLDPLESAEDDENSNNGWILLSTLNFLVCNCSSNLIPVMAAANLPSTLVKCLYLFFDLPEIEQSGSSEEDGEANTSGSSLTNSQLTSSISLSKITLDDIQSDLDRRLLLKKVFSQLLSRLSVHQSSIDDLTKKSDLESLFNATTNWCSNRYNIIWRETAAEVIINMTKNKFINLEYIAEKQCISTCIENMSKMFELNKASLKEIGEMWFTLISFFVEIMNCNQAQSDFQSSADENQLYSKQYLSALLIEFKQANGYSQLMNFILKLDIEMMHKAESKEEYLQLEHKLISMITLFVKVGTSELKTRPLSVNQLFIMDNFNMPRPSLRNCVRNLNAFNIFVNLWPNAQSTELQDFILTALITIYKSDKANYFLLDSQNTLAQFAEKLYTKPLYVQERFFDILEYIIFELRYIPCKELISVEILLKENDSVECNLLYLKSLLSIIKFNALFRDVYREVGIFDVLTQLFKSKMERILAGQFDDEFTLKEQTQLCDLLIEIVHTTLIGPNQDNCKLFEQINGPKLIYRILCSIDQFKSKHQKSLTKQMKRSSYIIVQQLIGYSQGEERLTLILDILHAASDYTSELELNLSSRTSKRKAKKSKEHLASEGELRKELIDHVSRLSAVNKFKIKIRLLKLLFSLLKDSHRCRAMFRKAGGFIYIISILVSMEGYFKRDGQLPDALEAVGWKKILNLLKLIFSVLTVSTRFEPANAKFISNEIGSTSLSDSLRLLGCFTQELCLQDDLEEVTKEQNKISKLTPEEKNEMYEQYIFEDYFVLDDNKPWSTDQIVCLLMKLMYEMALDQIEKNKTLVFMDKQKSSAASTFHASNRQSRASRPNSVATATSSRHSSCSLTIDYYSDYNFVNNTIIVHPSVIVAIFHLIPSIGSTNLRKFVLNNLISSLLDLERNQQVLCSVNFLNELLSKRFSYALINEHHTLHASLQKIFIQLASQQISSHNLRNYLRLARPLQFRYEEYQAAQKKRQALGKISSSCSSFSSSVVECLKSGVPQIPLVTIRTLSLIAAKNYRQEATCINLASTASASLMQSNPQAMQQQQTNPDLFERVVFQQPPFVEFDLNQEGFGCIFIPSIAPVNLNNASTSNSINFLNQNLITNAILNTTTDSQQSQSQLNGGIGVGERLFPPQNGLSYLSWFCIEQFPGQNSNSPTPNAADSCSPSPTPYGINQQANQMKNLLTKDVNNVRLLAIVRSLKNGKEFSCLQIQISPKDKCLIISTQEIPFAEQSDVQLNQDANVKIFHPNLFVPGKWHHLVVVLSRALLKNSTVTVYLDGQFLASQKLHYISTSVGMLNNLTNSQSNAAYVNAYIGIAPKLRCRVNHVWRQGPAYLIEENLTPHWVSFIYSLGTTYTGSFQCLSQQNQLVSGQSSVGSAGQAPSQSAGANLNVLSPLNQMQQISEEKIIFGLNAKANSSMTLAKLRRVYSRSDCKQLAELLSLSIQENATPITVLHNSAGHLMGASRSLGGFLIGYIGCRYFLSKPITSAISEIGGCILLQFLISNSNQEDVFVNAVKLFVVILNSSGNRKLQDEMKHINGAQNGYQILAVLLRKKKHLLNCEVFQAIVRLTCELEEAEREPTSNKDASSFGKQSCTTLRIKEQIAFKELIIEHIDLWWQDAAILKALLELFNDLLDSQRYRHMNLKKLRELGLLNKILFSLWTYKVSLKDQHLTHLTRKILFNLLNQTKRPGDLLHFGQFLCVYLQLNEKDPANADQIELRNSLLKIIMHLLTKNNPQANAVMQEEFVRVLGFDWFLLFVRNPSLSKETIVLGLVNLMVLISNPSLYGKFREASSNGGWLTNSRSHDGQITSNFNKDDELLSINDVKALGMNVINLGGNITTTIETNLSNLNNLTLENLNESITSNILDRDDGACNESLNKAAEVINLSGLKKVETSLFLIPGFQHLDWLLLDHLYEPRIYLILFQCLLGEFQQFSSALLETIERFDSLTGEQLKTCLNLDESSTKSGQTKASPAFFVSDIAISISNLISNLLWNRLRKKFMNAGEDENERKEEKLTEQQLIDFDRDYSLTLMQTLVSIYKTRKEFQFYCQNTPEFVFNLSQLLTRPIQHRQVESYEEIVSRDEFLAEFRMTTINFIKLIIVDSLICSNKPISRTQLIIMEQFLDTFQHCRITQKEILCRLITHLNQIVESQAEFQNFISVHVPSQAPRPVKTNIALNNIVAFISVLADKLWQDSLVNESPEIFEFCLNYLHRINLRSLETPPNARVMHSEELTRLFKSTNRIILYLLSRPILGIAERMSLIEFLNKIIQNKRVLFSQFNNDAQFFVCLTYCLMQFIDQEHVTLCSSKKTKSTWHVINENLNSLNQQTSIDEETPSVNLMPVGKLDEDEGALLIVSNAKKIWEDLFSSRRQLLEEALKIRLSSGNMAFGSNADIADLKKIRPNIFEGCLKAWNNFIENEQQIRILKAKCKQNLVQTKSLGTGNLQGSANLDSTSNFTLNNFAAVGERLTNVNKLSKMVGSGAGLMSKLVINTVSSTIKKDSFKSSASLSVDQQTGQNKQIAVPVWKLMNKGQVHKLFNHHLTLIMESIQFNYRNKMQKNQHLVKYVLEDWNNLEFEILLRERAIFECPNFDCKKLTKWMLDMTEGPNRKRSKLIRNDLFYVHYPYRPEMDSPKNIKQIKFRQPISWDSIEYHKRGLYQLSSRNASMNSSLENLNSVDEEAYLQSISAITSNMTNLSGDQNKSVDSEENAFDGDQKEGEQQKEGVSSKLSGDSALDSNELEQLESQSLVRLLEEGEKISQIYKCARVLGLDHAEGLILFGKEFFYLIDGFTLLKNNEIRDLDTLPVHLQDPVVPSCNTPTTKPETTVSSDGQQAKRKLTSSQSSGPTSTANLVGKFHTTKKICMKFAYEDIKEVQKRRYLLQPIALEVFSMDGRNSLLVFSRKQRNKIYTKLLSLSPNINDSAQESLAGQKRNVNIESGSNLLTNFFSETSVVQRWVRGEISNFSYLICLNNLAGRSYGDLMQYPTMPWIIADYQSETLNLNDKATFRDLSKPMGAQTEARLKQFLARYKDFDCIDIHDTPPYHYGTFYSSAMIVASYLIRLEPFTQHFLSLQGGHFDLADRMFHSIEEAWLSASQNNMADVKELIPEFFYLPEFLVNLNRFDLGVKQNGVALNDVVLPPWAKGDPKEFIRLNRLALESDYVSAHLHEWIDLVFGYKQSGQPAVDNVNVFHHLFYEGNVDINTIDDPLKKKAIIGFINNFGQIPQQLFKRPHPVKKAFSGGGGLSSISNTNTFFGSNMQINQLQASANCLSTPPLTSGSAGSLAAVQQLSTPTSNAITPLTPLFSSMLGSSSASAMANQQSLLNNDRLIMLNLQNLVQTSHTIKELRSSVGQIIQQDKNILAVEQNKVLIPPTCNKYVAFAYADRSIRIGNYESDRALSIFESDLLPCTDEILCCAVANSRTMITGGTNSVVSVWRLRNKLTKIELLQNLYGHTEPITALAASSAFGLLVSGSRDRTCLIWDLNRLTFVRQLGVDGGLEQSEEIKEKLKFATINQHRNGGLNMRFGKSTEDESEKPKQSGAADFRFASAGASSIFSAPISAICINDLNGDIATCCSSQLFVWTINGDLLACVDIFNYQYSNVHSENRILSMMQAPSNVQILCCTFSLYKEWDENNIFCVGCSDGAIRIYTIRYIQIPLDDDALDDAEDRPPNDAKPESVGELIDKVNELTNKGEDAESAPKTGRSKLTRSEECDGGEDENCMMVVNKDEMVRRMSLITIQAESQTQDDNSDEEPNSNKEEAADAVKKEPSINVEQSNDQAKRPERRSLKSKGRHCPKLDISTTANLVDPPRDGLSENSQKLKPGFKWSRQLILERELSLSDKVAISSIAVSKDNRTLYVGDVRGRLSSFVVGANINTPQSQSQSPKVVPKSPGGVSDAFSCKQCSSQFGPQERKVQCLNCSRNVCSKCFKIFELSPVQQYKVCLECCDLLNSRK